MGVASKQVSIDIRCTHQKFESKEIQEKGEEKQNAPRLKCPRCDSTNTKFCYFNNYSRSQPRHYCRSCRRHWTEGGTLRSVPIGGRRRNKRRKVPPSIATSTGNPLIRDAEGLGALDAMEGFFGVSPFMDDFVRLSSGFDLSYGERIYDNKATASSCSSSSIAMAWVEKEKALPASYWDFWDGAEDFTR